MSSPRIPARLDTNAVTPLELAEVVAILGHLEDRLVADARSTSDGRSRSLPITDLIDELVRSEGRPDLDAALVGGSLTLELARGLPFVLRIAARRRPRWALSLHDWRGGERRRTLDLVRATHRRLGGAPRHPSSRSRRPAAR